MDQIAILGLGISFIGMTNHGQTIVEKLEDIFLEEPYKASYEVLKI